MRMDRSASNQLKMRRVSPARWAAPIVVAVAIAASVVVLIGGCTLDRAPARDEGVEAAVEGAVPNLERIADGVPGVRRVEHALRPSCSFDGPAQAVVDFSGEDMEASYAEVEAAARRAGWSRNLTRTIDGRPFQLLISTNVPANEPTVRLIARHTGEEDC